MYWQSNVKKNPRGNRVFKTQFPFFFIFFTWSILLLCFSWFFFCGFLSFLCLGSLCSSMGFFLLRGLSILMGIVLLLPLWVSSSSFLLQFQIFFFLLQILLLILCKTRVPCGKNMSMSAIRTRDFEAQFLY